MADIKWIKIVTDIFDDEKILLIEAMPDSYAIIVCWFKLLCFAGKQNNNGVLMLNDKIAYTDQMLATVFRMNLNTVKLALSTFEHLGMIVIADDVIQIKNWQKYQSIKDKQTYNEYMKELMRKRRTEQKRLVSNAVSNAVSNVSSEEERIKNKEVRRKNKDTSYLKEDEEDEYIITSRRAAIENAWKDEFGRKATPAIVKRLLKVLERNAIDDATLKDCITRTARREANDPANYLETLIMEEAARDRKRAAATP